MGQGPSKRQEDLEREALIQEYLRDRAEELKAKESGKSNRKVTNYMAAQETSLARHEALAEKYSKRTWIPKYKGKTTKVAERRLNIMLSDLHYGADLDPKLVDFQYGPTEESRRTAAIATRVADYKRQYRKDTELHVHLIGDIIQGKLHDVQSAANLTTQIDRAIHCLVPTIEFWATEFRRVVVKTSGGNHGRDGVRHPLRAMQDKFDSNEFRIYRALKQIFKRVPNVEIHTEMRGYYIYEQFGMKGLMSHGDTIFNVGYPGKVIAVKSLSSQINDFRLAKPENNNVQLFGFGHVHTAMCVNVGGSTIITNGPMIPNDEFAQSIGIFSTACSQQLWETVPGYMFGDHRAIRVGVEDDKDSSLDKVIPVWTDLES